MYDKKYISKTLYRMKRYFYTLDEKAIDFLIRRCGLLSYGIGAVGGTITDIVNGYNWDFDGVDLSISAVYPELVTADVDNIIYTVGEVPIVYTWATMSNIINDQLIVNKTDESVSFYATSLSEPCYTKALLFQYLVEGLFDINNEPLFDVDLSRLYALRDGVTREA